MGEHTPVLRLSMLSLTAGLQEPITTTPRAQSLYFQEETDARYIHITHHHLQNKRERDKSGSQMASSHLPTTAFTWNLWIYPQSSPAHIAAEPRTAGIHVPVSSSRACAGVPSYLETPGSSLLGRWAWEAA